MRRRCRLLTTCAVAALFVGTGPDTASAAASIDVVVATTSSPTFWLEDRSYVVTVINDGDEVVSDLSGFAATPEAPAFAGDFGSAMVVTGNADDLLDPGEQWQYEVTVPTLSTWTFTVEGTTGGEALRAFASGETEPFSAAFPYPATLEIVNDSGPYPSGSPVEFPVTVTNDADFPLTLDCDQVVDDVARSAPGEPIGPPETSGDGDAILDPGETWTWTVIESVETSGFTLHVDCEIDRVGNPTGGIVIRDVGAPVALGDEALLDVVAVPRAGPVRMLGDREFDVTVSNLGGGSLSNIEVTAATDPPGGPVNVGPVPDTVVGNDDDVLDPGETWSYVMNVVVWDSLVVTATGLDSGGETIRATTNVSSGAVNGIPGPLVIDVEQTTAAPRPGDDVTWLVRISNAVGVELDIVEFGAEVTPPGVERGITRDDLGLVGLDRALLGAEEWSFTVTMPVSTDRSTLDIQFAVARRDFPSAVTAARFLRARSLPVTLVVSEPTMTVDDELPATGIEPAATTVAFTLTVIGAALVLLARRRPAI